MMNTPIQLDIAARIKPVNKPTDQVILRAGNATFTVSAHDVVRALLVPILNGIPQPVPASSPVSTEGPPAIGEYWAGHGGEYVGIGRLADGRQYHLVLGPEAPAQLNHADALKYVQGLTIDGHTDFARMTRRAGALCYANLPERFKKEWYWLDEQYEPSGACAWCQTFGYGGQHYGSKDFKYWVRAVRVEVIQ